MAWDKFTTLGAPLRDLEIAWQDRLKDAEAALKAKRPAAAMANGLYALEICLKVKICGTLRLPGLPRAFEIHDLASLLLLTGHSESLKAAPAQVGDNWNEIVVVSHRSNELRYGPNRRWRQRAAEEFMKRLREPPHGVLSWLSTLA